MAVFPDPPFFYKLFDDPNSDLYKQLTIPPTIPDKRIVFDQQETDEIPDHSINNDESISY